MQNTTESLQYKRGRWYFKTFSKQSDHHVAMANAAGFPKDPMDFLDHHAWFATGATPEEACGNLELKMGMQ